MEYGLQAAAAKPHI